MYQNLKREQYFLSKEITSLKQQIAGLPEGRLLCTKNNGRIKWYLSNGYHPIYLSKKEKVLAQKLALKKYYLLRLKELTNQWEAIQHFLEKNARQPSEAEKLLCEDSSYRPLLAESFQTFSSNIQAWLAEPYEKNSYYPENLIHRTLANHMVRSKSEVIIANALFHHHIPYRYECAFHCKSQTLFPDFTILHPQTGKLYYWEHFGMMDQPTYSDNAYNKLKTYSLYNIIPTINLITTYETAAVPLDSRTVEAAIEEHFQQ